MALFDRLQAALANGHAADLPILGGDDHRPDKDVAFKSAAVLVAITDRAEPGVLLTLRNEALRNHAGQVAFPGGRIDGDDADATAAALREAKEEIGLEPDQVRIVGETDVWHTGTGYSVTPVIGIVPPDLSLTPHEAEVAAIFEAPLAHLLDLSSYAKRSIVWRGVDREFLETNWEGYRIWGATAGMLNNLARRLEGFL